MSIKQLKPKARPSRQNLLRLCQIRSIVIVGLLALSLLFHFYEIGTLPLGPLIVILSALAFVNVLVFVRLQSPTRVSEKEFFLNLLVDVVFLTLVLYFTGGSTNPIVSYYLLPLIISAAVLRPMHTWVIAFLSITFYTLLLFYYQPSSIFSMSDHGAMTSVHFVGMWVNFGFSALLISWFVVQMAATLRRQSRDIAHTREAGLRNEQIISVASVAAGTAHEMRTPLATMAVTVDEIGFEHPELKPEIAVLEQQIERCEAVLQQLVSATTEDSRMVVTSVEMMFANLLHRWSLARPEARLQTRIAENVSKREIHYDQSLYHALTNFLNNAVDASPDYVAMRVDVIEHSLLICIEDHGPGIPVEIAKKLGKKYVSGKQGGLGLGVLLSQASIERLGGEVTLKDMPGTGTRLEIWFPLYEGSDDE